MQPLVLKMSLSLDGFAGTTDGGVAPLLELSDDESKAWVVEAISGASAHLMGRKTFSDMASWWPNSTEVFAEPMNRIPKIVFTRSPDFDPAAPGATTGAVTSMAALTGELPPRTGPDAATLKGWRNPEVLVGDLAGHVARLKQRPPAPSGGTFLLAHGGAGFARALIATGEIDEYRLVFAPIALGTGLPIFSDLGSALRLELIDQRRFTNGIVANTYRPRQS
jgi:dihydrofolate reductase